MSRYLVALGAVSLVLLTVVLLGGLPDSPTTGANSVRQSASVRAVADPPSPVTRSPEEIRPRRLVNDRDLTVEEVKRIGLLQRESRWIGEAMDKTYWAMKNEGAEVGDDGVLIDGRQVWENSDQERLIWWVENGRVVRAEAEFPKNSSSASVTALAIYFVGTNHELPFKLEDPKPGSNRVVDGNFFTPDGRRFFFRGRLRGDGEDISGPGHFAIGMEPFDGQSRLEPPIDGFFPED